MARPALPGVVAHRGASGLRPEHTMDAYTLAIEHGADGLECDVRLTRDGHLVCIHDRRIDRTSDGRGLVSGLTLAQLSAFDYGSWGDWRHQDRDDLNAGGDGLIGLLTFDALLGLVADHPSVTLFVETKHPVRYGGLVERTVATALARHGLADPPSKAAARVVLMSFSTRAVQRMRAELPRLPTVQLLSRLSRRLRDGWLPPWADLTGPGVHLLRADPGYVQRAADRGHPTYCWTVDEPADVQLCARTGVRWLATNTPAATRLALTSASRDS